MPALVRRTLLMLGLLGLLARVVYLNQVSALPFFDHPVGDSALYLARAREILSGRWLPDRPFFYGGIFYPYAIAATMRLFGGSLYPLILLQVLAGCALGFLLAAIAGRGGPSEAERSGRVGGDPVVPVATGALAFFYGPFAFLEADLLAISWTLLLLALAAWLLLRQSASARGIPALAGHIAAGLCLGLAASERPNLVALLPCVALWAAARGSSTGRAMRGAAVIGGGALVILAVGALNHAGSGRWVPLTTSGGINFQIGNHAGARGTFDEPWSSSDTEFTARVTDLEVSSLEMARRLSGRPLDPVEASEFWFARGAAWIRENPGDALRLYLRKLRLLLAAQEVPNHHDYEFLREIAPALRFLPIGFGLVAPLGLYAFLSPACRQRMGSSLAWLLGILTVVPAVTVLPFFVADRYRAAMVPPLLMAAGFGVARLADLLREPLTRRGASLRILCLGLACAALTVPVSQPDRSRDHWILAQGWRRQGELPRAIEAYEAGLAIAPDNAVMRNNFGTALEASGQADRAEREYRRAAASDPSLALPRRNLGLLLMRAGRGQEALGPLLEAARRLPEDPDVWRAIAVIRIERGEAGEAREAAGRVLTLVPGDRVALRVMEAAGR